MKKIYKAIADFQQEVPIIHKSTKGHNYTYADLTAIFKVINPLMKKNGLGFTQAVEGTSLKTVIFHVESGETFESCADIPQGITLMKMNGFQVLGSAITYMRRYQLSAMLGLVTDKDTDAGGQQAAPQKAQPKKPITNDLIESVVKWAHDNNQTVADCKKHYTMSAEIETELKDKLVAIKQLA